jgi:hypothetical protein
MTNEQIKELMEAIAVPTAEHVQKAMTPHNLRILALEAQVVELEEGLRQIERLYHERTEGDE